LVSQNFSHLDSLGPPPSSKAAGGGRERSVRSRVENIKESLIE
jgi:hypothetical protein